MWQSSMYVVTNTAVPELRRTTGYMQLPSTMILIPIHTINRLVLLQLKTLYSIFVALVLVCLRVATLLSLCACVLHQLQNILHQLQSILHQILMM